MCSGGNIARKDRVKSNTEVLSDSSVAHHPIMTRQFRPISSCPVSVQSPGAAQPPLHSIHSHQIRTVGCRTRLASSRKCKYPPNPFGTGSAIGCTLLLMKNTHVAWRTASYRRRTRPYRTKDYRVSSQESGRRHPGREGREVKGGVVPPPLHPLPHAKRRAPIPSHPILSCPLVWLKSSEVNLKKLVAKCYSPSEGSDQIRGPVNSMPTPTSFHRMSGLGKSPLSRRAWFGDKNHAFAFIRVPKTIGFRQPIGGAAPQGSKIGVQPKTHLSRGNRGIRSYDREV